MLREQIFGPPQPLHIIGRTGRGVCAICLLGRRFVGIDKTEREVGVVTVRVDTQPGGEPGSTACVKALSHIIGGQDR
jgi:hypothetical protein